MNTPPSHPSGAVSRRRRWASRLSTLVVAAVAAATLAPQAASAVPTTVFSDDFARNVAGSWGASAAGSYTGYSVPGALSVDGSAAQLNLAPAQSVSVLAGTGSAGDVRADASIRLGQSAGRSYFAFILRYQNDGSAYRGRLELDATGTPTLAVSRVGGRSDKQLAAVRLTEPLDRGEWYTLSYSVTGTSPVTVRASLTKRGADAATPQLTASDADGSRIEDAGRVGLWAYISSSATKNTELSLDDLAFADGAAPLTIPAGGPSPTPTPTATPTPTTPPAATSTPTPTPTPTTPQPPATGGGSASSGDAGSVDVGRAAYPVPTGAVFVDAHTARSGNGSASSPFTTVQGAINAAKPGGTIVVRQGVYHEALSIPSNKPLTIQAYPNEAVWFDGSRVVSAWTPSGSVWVSTGWTTSFDSSMRGQASMYVNSEHPTANRPDQVFVDGIALRQVVSTAEVVAGTFAVDDAGDRLILGTNPNGREVRASDISQAIDATAPNVTLQGFGVRRYATTFGATAQVRMHNTGAVIRNLVIEDGAFIGLAVQNDDSVIDHVTARRNGIMGIGVNQAYNLVLSNSLVTDNNAQHFNDIPVAGGIKITRSRNVTVTGNVVSNNDGSGIWFDESCYDVKIVRNTANDNSTSGIQLELSDTAVIAGNTSTGTRTGIQIINTGNLRIYNNELGANADNGIRLRQDARRSATHATGRDPRMGIDPGVPWITRNITIANNVFGSGGRYSIRANDGATNRPVDSWNVVITGNLFNNKAAGGPTMVAWGTGDNRSFEGYQSPAELSAAKNRSWVNAIAASALPLASMASAAASAASTAAPIPSDVAALLGVGATQRFVGVRSR